MDQFWLAAIDFLKSNGLMGKTTVAPLQFREIFPVSAYDDVMPADAAATEALVLHKGRYKELDRGYVRAALKRLHPSFANEVFIVLTAEGATLDEKLPHLAHMSVMRLWAEAEDSEPQPRPREAAIDLALRRVTLARWWDELRASPRALEPLRLIRFGRKSFSQNDEDGIILEIFNRIGTRGRRFVEFGVETGMQCNTALLLSAGWSGLWLDAMAKNVMGVKEKHAEAIQTGRLAITQTMVTAENINALIGAWRADTDAEIDLLSIDIDRNDYWVWKAINVVRPRVVVIEYNASYPPPLDFLVPYDAEAIWNMTNYTGASLSMLEKLGRTLGYALVGCCLAGVNAFFVREDELKGPDGRARFHAPFTAAEHYEPPRYELSELSFGHTLDFGPNAAAEEVARLAGKE